MLTKAEKTTQYILETVAPYFNKHGYTGTSLSDITKATGLSKGAIYGNFESKEQLALEAFNFNIRRAMGILRNHMNMDAPGLARLFAMTNFFRNYYIQEREFGGCPMQNVGIDSLNHNTILHHRVLEVMKKLIRKIADMIDEAKQDGDIKEEIDSLRIANNIYAQIQGSIFMANMMHNEDHMNEMMNHIDRMIKNELMK
ncbi:MAG: TetR/AcrR family transcriptional regulator [Reichenbachiella sp.]